MPVERGEFVRVPSCFRLFVGGPDHPVSAGRYHLYVSPACPWAHRVILARRWLGLEAAVSMSMVEPEVVDGGWRFSERYPDPHHGDQRLYQLYLRANPRYSGRVTVPVLWDTVSGVIVNNESAYIVRMFNGPLRPLGSGGWLGEHDLYPEALRPEIDEINAFVYERVNNGVYRAGFAGTQEVYASAVTALFSALDALEARLSSARWLVGDRLTEADLRLFTTLFRFDIVYYGHFKCNLRQLRDYPNLWAYTLAIYQLPGVREGCDAAAIKRHYYRSHGALNPSRIVPLGPMLNLDAPHDRDARVYAVGGNAR